MESDDNSSLAKGLVERIGLKGTSFVYKRADGMELKREIDIKTTRQAVDLITSSLVDETSGVIGHLSEIKAVGHRIVHGGEKITTPVLIDEDVKAVIDECAELAPLHNPPNLEGIMACEDVLPGVPQVGVFDTAFHTTMPSRAYLYGIPLQLYQAYRVRRYGFHGTSHKYVHQKAIRYFDRDIRELKIITCHLGNGCSISAVEGVRCIDTSMGFTPLEGLMMGTRCGDIDAAVIFFLMDRKNMSAGQVSEMLNRKSGLLGLAGIGSSDLRDIEAKVKEGHREASSCFDAFCYRIRKYIGSYIAAMEGVDGIVFTGGIGENSDMVRARVCGGLEKLGIVLDVERNRAFRQMEGEIHKPESAVKILVIPTNEEAEIARETLKVISGHYGEVLRIPNYHSQMSDFSDIDQPMNHLIAQTS
jgi:acetate kinase